MELAFDPFGWATLTSHAESEDLSLGELVARACGHFRRDLAKRRPAAGVPWFARTPVGEPSEVHFVLPAETWINFAEEAVRQGLAVERLVEHAALHYVAATDAARTPSPA
jgi:hypothetical protein